MDAFNRLKDEIARSQHPLVNPQPLAHSQELGESLPLVRRHIGPRAWYLCLESGTAQPPERPPR